MVIKRESVEDRMTPTIHHLPGLSLTDHQFAVPLDHARPHGPSLTVFGREAVAPDKQDQTLPWLVFFQGGPGYGSPRPEERSGWLKRALQEYRVLLLDQRGTGRSTPVTHETLAALGTAAAQAAYLKHFRADAIVRDAEWIRRELLGDNGRWSVLGQSYGGFCATHYLSAAPDSLAEVVITGGLPPLERPVDAIYRATYRRVLEKNALYYQRYPGDAARAWEIVHYLAGNEVELPAGGRLTPRRFQQLGMNFGASTGLETVHYLLEEAFVAGAGGRVLSYAFLRHFENLFAFETNPIYALLHEACYTQGAASNWSAERVRADFPEFELASERPVMFTGEMVYPWMFEEYEVLRPLAGAADILAQDDTWPRLYDVATLAANTAPCAAAVYYDDMYVERAFSEETAGHIAGLKMWLTNEYQHNALRADGERVFGRLLDLLHGQLP